MTVAPKIPQEISSNGSEVWDWAGKFSDHMQRVHRIRELENGIAKIGTVCGGCNHWMTNQCPKEWNDRGMKKGPSCEGRACDKFSLKRWDAERRDKLQAELDALRPTTTEQKG